MITLLNEVQDFTLATSYADLTVGDYEFIRENETDQLALAKRLTGLGVAQIALIDWENVRPYLDFLQITPLKSVEPINIIKVNGTIYTLPEAIGTCWWAQKLSAFGAIVDHDLLTMLCVYLQPLIFGPDFDPDKLEKTKNLLLGSDMDSVYSCIAFLNEQIREIAKTEKKTLDLKPTPEQMEAGIQAFNVLGDFNVIDQMAGGDPLKYDQVLQMDYDTIYQKLLKNNISAKFDRNYTRITNRPKPGKK